MYITTSLSVVLFLSFPFPFYFSPIHSFFRSFSHGLYGVFCRHCELVSRAAP